MKKILLSLLGFSLMVVTMAGTSYSWEGRMGSMGDPYGLVKDESDFFIHPAKIINGEGVSFFGGYRFTYTGIANWDLDRDSYTPAGVLAAWRTFDLSGDVYEHDALLGAAFPLGPGRMGLFFEYSGMRDDYDGDYLLSPANEFSLELASDLDDFALRLLYGLPIGGLNLGGEVQFSYRGEENESFFFRNDQTLGFLNRADFPFCFLPYDSSYWEALFKGSIEGMVGPLDVEFTLRGGFIFGGDNNWEYNQQTPVGTPVFAYDLDGGVNGWRIGGDLWMRYPVDAITLPFLVRIDYQEKTRDGDGVGAYGWAGHLVDYENQERSFTLTAGGGLDKELNAGTRIAGGIYYQYLQRNDSISRRRDWVIPGPIPVLAWEIIDNTCPDCTEHQGIVQLAGEHEITPTVTLRAGLNFFCGWTRMETEISVMDNTPISLQWNYPRDGLHWGIGASLGGTVRFDSFTLEPFVTGGYQGFDLAGDGDYVQNGVLNQVIETVETRNEWYISGGCSFLYDLP